MFTGDASINVEAKPGSETIRCALQARIPDKGTGDL
jgi:hypothetical protein